MTRWIGSCAVFVLLSGCAAGRQRLPSDGHGVDPSDGGGGFVDSGDILEVTDAGSGSWDSWRPDARADGSWNRWDAGRDGGNVRDGGLWDAADAGACDAFEPNNGIATARALTAGVEAHACLSSSADIDMYSWQAPVTAAGGLFRMEFAFSDCAIDFGFFLTEDPGTPMLASGNAAFTAPAEALQHHLVQVVASGARYHVRIAAAKPFTGACSYSIRTSHVPIPDPFEPDTETAPSLALGATAQAYFACVPHARVATPDECRDRFAVAVGSGSYTVQVSGFRSNPGLAPCLAIECGVAGRLTYGSSYCDPPSAALTTWSMFAYVSEPSTCFVTLDGTLFGTIQTGAVGNVPPAAPFGADLPYHLRISG